MSNVTIKTYDYQTKVPFSTMKDDLFEWITYGMIEGNFTFVDSLNNAISYLDECPDFVPVSFWNECEAYVKQWFIDNE
jgi:hypothetical protein